MARRRAGKANPNSAVVRGGGQRSKKAKAGAPVTDAPAGEATLNERIAALERERDALRATLQQERARRRTLEQVHAATRDRIAWALESLQAILDARA
jgi:hypothetical protein